MIFGVFSTIRIVAVENTPAGRRQCRGISHMELSSHIFRDYEIRYCIHTDYGLNLIMNEKKKVYFKRTESPQPELHFPNATERQVVNSKTQCSQMGSKGRPNGEDKYTSTTRVEKDCGGRTSMGQGGKVRRKGIVAPWGGSEKGNVRERQKKTGPQHEPAEAEGKKKYQTHEGCAWRKFIDHRGSHAKHIT